MRQSIAHMPLVERNISETERKFSLVIYYVGINFYWDIYDYMEEYLDDRHLAQFLLSFVLMVRSLNRRLHHSWQDIVRGPLPRLLASMDCATGFTIRGDLQRVWKTGDLDGLANAGLWIISLFFGPLSSLPFLSPEFLDNPFQESFVLQYDTEQEALVNGKTICSLFSRFLSESPPSRHSSTRHLNRTCDVEPERPRKSFIISSSSHESTHI